MQILAKSPKEVLIMIEKPKSFISLPGTTLLSTKTKDDLIQQISNCPSLFSDIQIVNVNGHDLDQPELYAVNIQQINYITDYND